jgi:signal transduction histidine kinase/DNA-binding response OmpR family regulator
LNSVQSRYISAITEDKEGNLWIGTDWGIAVLQKETGRFVHYINQKNDPASLSSNNVIDIKEDSKGRIWIGTHGGLNLFNKQEQSFQSFTDSDGLPNNSVLTIQEDGDGNLWMGTPNGISSMAIHSDSGRSLNVSFKNYDEADGLQGKQFNENAAYRTSRNELIFGGANGFNIFKPEQLGMNKNKPQVVLTDFQLFNKSIKPGENVDGEVLLKQAITEATRITLPANKNVFSIEFAALNFFHPEKNEYKYKLEEFNTDWLSADSRSRRVTFTNLDPGDYVFHVKAANNDGVWNEEGTSIIITVLPPFWKTRMAMVLYFLAVILGLLVVRKMIQQREQMKFAIQQERQEAIRMHELDMMKIKFFTNVSHEFRTPLTLILTPMEKLLRQVTDVEQKGQFELIQRNGKRLLNLVNQLLDFRKMEVQEIKFSPSEGDVIKFIRETVYSFSDLSEKKHIKLDFHSSLDSLETIFDQDKVEKILFNLLSNAFKFTPEYGSVSVDVVFQDDQNAKWLKIRVTDTGIGIPLDKLDKIFDRFFQNELPKSMVNQGSGIGLSITKEFVKIHGGSITVESEQEKGSCFTVMLPVNEIISHAGSPSVETILTPVELEDDPVQLNLDQSVDQKPLVLLIEDNEDFRFYLKDNLKLTYDIVEARDGKEGFKKALSHFPDLIVSDVMMPEMNGLELCRKIKSDQRVSHIPIILLTARTSEEQRLEGFEIGADDYINKPFNFELLESRIRNLIAQRQKLHVSLSKQAGVKASELNITSLDEKFIQNAIRYVEENVSNADYSVEDLGKELGISRAHFYKKIISLTGKSPLEFIRAIRLQQAAQLLEKSQLTVAEVAYKVGFNNPKYFAKYFKETFHVLPSAYAAGKRRA